VLARVRPAGPACHTGAVSCFGDASLGADALGAVDRVIAARAAATAASTDASSDSSYTRRLLADRNLRLKKLGEETAELVTACADGDAARAAQEAMDVLYHVLVAARALGVTLDDVRAVAESRQKGL
jgi:phosphoribosyl-ATP pyrophosphohydrolase/phosphoribosyl-AMP cyclohydrolase